MQAEVLVPCALCHLGTILRNFLIHPTHPLSPGESLMQETLSIKRKSLLHNPCPVLGWAAGKSRYGTFGGWPKGPITGRMCLCFVCLSVSCRMSPPPPKTLEWLIAHISWSYVVAFFPFSHFLGPVCGRICRSSSRTPFFLWPAARAKLVPECAHGCGASAPPGACAGRLSQPHSFEGRHGKLFYEKDALVVVFGFFGSWKERRAESNCA